MKAPREFGASRSRWPLVDISPLDRTTGERLGTPKDVPQGVTVARLSGSDLVQCKQAARSRAIVGDDEGPSPHCRGRDLVHSDALHLQGMKRTRLLQHSGGFVLSDFASLYGVGLPCRAQLACWLRKWRTPARVQLPLAGSDHSGGRPLAVAPMGAGHLVGDCGIAPRSDSRAFLAILRPLW